MNSNKKVATKRFVKHKRKQNGSKPNECGASSLPNVAESSNDVSWYSSDPVLLSNVARIPFYRRTGDILPVDDELVKWSSGGDAKKDEYVPGIICARIYPAIGSGFDSASPLNLAATKIYTFVRHMNSGHANYEKSDLMLMIASVSSIFSYINYLMRIYGTMTMYSPFNRYMPQALIRMMGVDFNDVHRNYADLRYGINLLIKKASILLTPSDLSLFNREAFLYNNIYTDGSSVKDQLYMNVPAAFLKYSHDVETQAGQLVYVKFDTISNARSVQDLINFGHELLDAVLEEEDIGIMCGDLLKAYQGNVNTLVPMDDNYSIQPIYDPVFLEQFKNSRSVDIYHVGGFDINMSKVSQSNNLVLARNYTHGVVGKLNKAAVKNIMMANGSNKVLTTESPDVTPELVMELTRLVATCSDPYVLDDNSYAASISVASDLVCDYIICTFNDSGTLNIGFTSCMLSLPDWCAVVGALSSFKYAPEVIYYDVENVGVDAYNVKSRVAVFNKDNYTVVTKDELSNLNNVAIMSMLGIGN